MTTELEAEVQRLKDENRILWEQYEYAVSEVERLNEVFKKLEVKNEERND
jgi:hypothetical protein